jgi:hypothetical protein
MKKLTFIMLVLLTFNLTDASGWGAKGHDIVAAIAEQHLTPKAKRKINRLLDGHSIVYYSSWMDSIQNSPYWEDGYNKTKTWHYANVDKGFTYETMTKNPDGDVVTGLKMLTEEMTENYSNLTDSMRVDYLKMIIHMVGDMHCPMHAGRLSDLGGNRTKVIWFRNETNLHSLWDSSFIDAARKWSYTEWCEHLDKADRKQRKSITEGSFEDWFVESAEEAAKIYDYIEDGKGNVPELSYQFIYDFSPLLEQQLMYGGYRLAEVLNSIFR